MLFIARHLKHPEGQKIANMRYIFAGRVAKGEEVSSFLRLGWAMLDDMELNKMEKKFSSAIPALDDLLAVTI